MTDRVAICIGIDKYTNFPGHELDFCAADATLVADYLELPEYSFSTHRLINEEATRYNILELLQSMRRDPPKFFVFYFAGHGMATDFGSFLVTHDGREFELGIAVEMLSLYVDHISHLVPHCLVVLDCCHSGATPLTPQARSISAADVERGISSRSESKTLLAACRPEQTAEENGELGHGVFTFALVEGLDGQAADVKGSVTVGGLSEFVGRRLEEFGCEQIMVSKGDHAGRVVLATGLPPISRTKLPAEERKAILGEGRQFIDDYTSQLMLNLDDWKSDGYRAASQALAPTAAWFTKKEATHRDLATDPEFAKLHEAVRNRVKQLAEVDRGTRISEGIISERLGGGGFGTVWKISRDEQGLPPLAYKIYHPADYGVLEKRGLFHRGYRAMQQLDHPRVVKVHGYSECPVGFFMDYIEGPTLRDMPAVIDDPAALLRFMILIGETISHAHSRRVIHRDIKPENILAVYDQEKEHWLPFLTDFDLAWFSQATQVTKQAWGNLSYAAPEQLGNPRSPVARKKAVDIYAFGQVAFFAVAGSDPTPIGRADNSRALRERLEKWPSAEAAERFLAWYEKCTADIRDRYPDFLEVMDELFSVESILRTEEQTQLTLSQFTRELAFALSGFSSIGLKSAGAFSSTSGRTSIVITAEEIFGSEKSPKTNIEVELRLHEIPIETSSNERARSILNNRINEILSKFPNTKRIPGTHGIFSTTIHISNASLDRAGVKFAQKVLRRVLDSIER
ncbi:protein kinase [Micromonospora wenchangensis]|uniref:protein kinase domain-containing protein n=1 Tax=Micromonospora wenchangensis TaxID=1185415 RepID=UPI0033D31888